MSQIEISILIVSWNSIDYLDQTLASISKNPPPFSFEVIVVDNGSLDGSPEMVATRYDWVHLIRAERNGGFSYGNNLAIARSSGRILFLLNPDTQVQPNTFSGVPSFFERHPNAGILGGRIVDGKGRLQYSTFSFPSWTTLWFEVLILDQLFPKSRRFNQKCLGQWAHDADRQVDWVSGAGFAIPRSVVDVVGKMDERFFLYYEEVDWCRRVIEAGYEVWFTPSLLLVHFGGKSTEKSAYLAGRESRRSRYAYFVKHHAIPELWVRSFVQAIELVPFGIVLATLALIFWGVSRLI